MIFKLQKTKDKVSTWKEATVEKNALLTEEQ